MTLLEGGGAPPDLAPFDDAREALRYALNADQVSLPAPYMNRAMAQTPGAAERRKKPTRSERAVMWAVGASSLDELRAILKSKGKRTSFLIRPPRPTQGLDKAHLAGFILREFERLEETHQLVLTGLLTNPVMPCSCCRPCCSGWIPVTRWVTAVDKTCEILKERALVLANQDAPAAARRKVGLSTQPVLRRALVKDYFQGIRGRSLADLASVHGITDETVARHRGWIEEWLDIQERQAWESLQMVFDRVGITGPWL